MRKGIGTAGLIILLGMVTLAGQPVQAASTGGGPSSSGDAALSSSEEEALQKKDDELQRQRRALRQKQEDLENAKEESQQSLSDSRNEVSSLTGQQDALGEEIDSANADLVEVIANVDLIQGEIDQKNAEIEETSQAYNDAKAAQDTLYSSMKERVKFMYEEGDAAYVKLLLEANSYGDLMNKAAYAEELYDYDRQQLDAYVAAKEEAANYKAQLEDEKSDLETSQYELTEEKTHMESLISQYQTQYDDYGVEIARARQDAAVYSEQLRQQTAQISALSDQVAARDAEIAANKEALSAAKARKQASASSSVEAASLEGPAGKKETEPAKADKKKEKKPGNRGSHSGGYAAAGSATGSNVAAFAKQFVGNPYVPGGTSLTNGADCSGFVQSVYRAFGVSLPRTSWSQRGAGREVSYSEAQPGDLICYPGHVGIYIGNGMIVHASSVRTGIKISNATYRTMVGVRRIL